MLELPLTNLEAVDVTLSSPDRCFVGEHTPSATWRYAEAWLTDGTLQGWISTDDAMVAHIPDLGMSLCDMLCGASCVYTEPADCPNPAEEIPDGSGAWGYELQASLGAGACTIL
jgi:hypothetical protein